MTRNRAIKNSSSPKRRGTGNLKKVQGVGIVKDYIKYDKKRMQQKLGHQSPVNFREQAA
ncbi:IS3 family transposase [Listeria ivanovii]|uniref:IS3 family transposase n=1 Tax=Listeria ivanovii TaxID=1638 RepID=UPI003CF206EB